ncbi:MAG: hypothetical protein U0359_35710 [Byssovorax sp.]
MRAKAQIDEVVALRSRRRDPREERDSGPPPEPRFRSNRPDPRQEPEWGDEPRLQGISSFPPAATYEGDELEGGPPSDRAKAISSHPPAAPVEARPSDRPAPPAPIQSSAPPAPIQSSAPPAPIQSSAPPALVASGAVDPRLIEVEPLLARGDWAEIVKRLGPPEHAAELPPTLGLIFALAQREAAGELSATPANVLAIKHMATLFTVSPESAIALVLAKRLLRQNPTSWRTAQAPPAKVSVPLIVLAIAIGAVVGGYLSLGSFRF